MAQHYMGETDYGRQRLRQDMALLDIPPDRRAEGGYTVAVRDIVYISSSVWLGVSTMLLSIFQDTKDTDTKGRAVAIWVMVTGYMAFNILIRR